MTKIDTHLSRTVLTLVNIIVLILFLGLMAAPAQAQRQSVTPIDGDTRTSPPNTYVVNNFPYRAVAKLFVTFPNGKDREGTGVFIGADRVFTAAHVVYQPENGGMATSVEIIPAFNGGSTPPFGSTGAKKISVPSEYIQNQDDNYDFAAIVTIDGLGHKSGWLGYYVPSNKDLGAVTIIGYPSQRIAESSSNATLANGNEIQYDADTSGGMSGAPIIKKANNTWLVIGIHTRGGRGLPFNFGVRFSDYFLKNL